jgi:hypothetical protein
MKEKWTPEEDRLLIALVNKYHDPQRKRQQWDKIAPKFDRSLRALQQRYHIVLKNQPQDKPERKRSITRKSFLWGLYTVEREE